MDMILLAVGQALKEAFDMIWEVLWPLVLGVGFSAVVQALVLHRTLARLLGDASLRSLTLAALFGFASSSCSYAAMALARSLFRKGASFSAAMVFHAFANGSRAVLPRVTFTLKTARTWAPFSFPSRYHARTPIRFTEDRGQLHHALPPASLRHTVRWDCGDGTHAMAWAVRHRSAHAGIYRVTVHAYLSTWHQYFPFDHARISIARRSRD
jgi:hypothetical protein